jgi:hypothetical protein
MKEASMDDLHVVLHSFRKEKIPRLDGWPIEFFLGFFELIKGYLTRFIDDYRDYRRF